MGKALGTLQRLIFTNSQCYKHGCLSASDDQCPGTAYIYLDLPCW